MVQPRGGTLAVFPSHCIHAVAPVVGTLRYNVTMWLSVAERIMPHDHPVGRLAQQLPSEGWVEAYARVEQVWKRPPVPPGTIVGNQVFDQAARAAGLKKLHEAAEI